MKKSCFKYREANYKIKTKSKVNDTLFHKGKGNTCLIGKHLLILHFLIVLNSASSYYGKYKHNLRMQDVPMVGPGVEYSISTSMFAGK